MGLLPCAWQRYTHAWICELTYILELMACPVDYDNKARAAQESQGPKASGTPHTQRSERSEMNRVKYYTVYDLSKQ